MIKFSDAPCIGWYMKSSLYEMFIESYDILVNFIEANEEAIFMLKSVIQNEEYCHIISKEVKENIKKAEKFVSCEIEDLYPEISKAIQHRRAQFYLLVHSCQYVGGLLHKGQIEEKDANAITSEID